MAYYQNSSNNYQNPTKLPLLNDLTQRLAKTLQLGDGSGLIEVLKNTAFRGNVNDDQMAALLIIANQYKLNPWTKEIYAFPAKGGGITPIVGVDGWARIINEHPQFDGIVFEQDNESCTCSIFRKDRNRPTVITEYLSECKGNTEPWNKFPKRMLRHKAMMQCARVAFGFAGIYDQDDAEFIAAQEAKEEMVNVTPQQATYGGITQDQHNELENLLSATNADRTKFLQYVGKSSIEEFDQASYQKAMAMLNKKAVKAQQLQVQQPINQAPQQNVAPLPQNAEYEEVEL